MTVEQSIRDKVAALSDMASEARLTSRLATDPDTQSKYAKLADDFDRLIAEAMLTRAAINRQRRSAGLTRRACNILRGDTS